MEVCRWIMWYTESVVLYLDPVDNHKRGMFDTPFFLSMGIYSDYIRIKER